MGFDYKSRFPNLPWGDRIDPDEMIKDRLKREAPRVEADIRRLKEIRKSLEGGNSFPIIDLDTLINFHKRDRYKVCDTCGGKDRCNRYGSPPQGCLDNYNEYYRTRPG